MKRSWLTLLVTSLFVLASVPAFADAHYKFVIPDTTDDGYLLAGSDISVDVYGLNDAADPIITTSWDFRFRGTGDLTTITYRGVGAVDLQDARTLDDLGLNMIDLYNDWAGTTIWALINQFFGVSVDGSLPDTINYTTTGLSGWATNAEPVHYISFALSLPANDTGTFCIDSVTTIPDVDPPGKFDWLFEVNAHFRLEETDPVSYCWTVVKPTDVKEVESSLLPTEFELGQNYPNPFNPNTNIQFAVPKKSHVNISIYNILGQKIAGLVDDEYAPGYYVTDWNGTSENGTAVASGIYFYKIEADNFKSTKKLMLLR
nr:T9SS type A sorting domain-containing protein [candidate division Zixibacteria bacterium]